MNSYHDDFDSISKTMMAYYHESPFEFYQYFVGKEAKPPQPKAVVLGAICHTVLLEDKPLKEVACVYPAECLRSNGTINPKPSREWESSLEHWQYPVKESFVSQVVSLLNAIKDHPVMKLIESADAKEKAFRWTDFDSGLDCRCKPDFYCVADKEIIIYDLKFTAQIKPWNFWRTAKQFRYWMQDAHYSQGMEFLLDKPCKFVFWAIEDKPPYRIARYEYTRDSRENARAETNRLRASIANSHSTGIWEDSWTSGTNDLIFTPSESHELELDWSGIE